MKSQQGDIPQPRKGWPGWEAGQISLEQGGKQLSLIKHEPPPHVPSGGAGLARQVPGRAGSREKQSENSACLPSAHPREWRGTTPDGSCLSQPQRAQLSRQHPQRSP